MKYTTFKFYTMNNVEDPTSLQTGKGVCADIVNADSDSSGGIALRDANIIGLAFQPVTESMGSRDYWAVGNTVYCSKALSDDTDDRFTKVISLDDTITMIRRVDGGLFIGSTTELHFLTGTDPQFGDGFTDTWTLPYGVIMGTGCHVRGELIPLAQMSGNCCIFASHRGVIIGGSGGQIFNLSHGKVSYEFGYYGKAFIREKNGQAHYIFSPDVGNEAYNIFPDLNLPINY